MNGFDDYHDVDDSEPPEESPLAGWAMSEDMAAVVRARLDELDAPGEPLRGFDWADD
ncbi:hypothetical protein Caci_2901 [Catenulispora acidiphila DSM 44928]|uniref:Uncharacterized protein n=1 Tax=Catenulispora acidiphila (strain DSM 44928 / JCM 14897 / NBRC 102108 / NRRL B-24433 / ID139908) TaxID=479433 RepID=C7Q2R8_CATAD|nr:hypothetical protein [Catenulispora acidiphila]ACU71810.1 hypothetical protein Caci_2901 [Catenulispora acidiphila DSM 44928]